MIIKMSAKCSDLFNASLIDNDKEIGEYHGYVPKFFPEEHYGDYVRLDIDIETGKILNWKAPTQDELEEVFKKEDEKCRRCGNKPPDENCDGYCDACYHIMHRS